MPTRALKLLALEYKLCEVIWQKICATPAKDQKGKYKFHVATLESLSVRLMQCACSLFSEQKLFKQYTM